MVPTINLRTEKMICYYVSETFFYRGPFVTRLPKILHEEIKVQLRTLSMMVDGFSGQ